jgi:hypothetical protein
MAGDQIMADSLGEKRLLAEEVLSETREFVCEAFVPPPAERRQSSVMPLRLFSKRFQIGHHQPNKAFSSKPAAEALTRVSAEIDFVWNWRAWLRFQARQRPGVLLSPTTA